MSKRSRIYQPRRGDAVNSSPAAKAVERVYRGEDGKLPDFTRLDRRPKSWRRWMVAGALVTLGILAAVAWASFLIFRPYVTSNGNDVRLVIEAPPAADVGSEITYHVRITNDEHVPLAQATLRVRLPEYFIIAAADPAPEDAQAPSWTLGTISANSERVISIRGILYGNPGSATRAEAALFYRPANFNSDFETNSTVTTTLGASPVAITVNGPERAMPGEAITYTFTYEHGGTRPLPSSFFSVELPRTFTLANTQPARPDRNALRWPLGELTPGAKGTISVTGAYAGDAQGVLDVRANVALALDDRQIPLTEQKNTTEIIGGGVTVTVTANDQINGFVVRPGETLRFRVAIRNAGNTELHDLIVRAIFDATSVTERSALNFNALTDAANGTIVGEQLAAGLRRGIITWTNTQRPDLAVLKPGEQRTIDVTIPIHTPSSLPGLPKQGRIAFSGDATVTATDTNAQSRTIASAPIELDLRSP
ncbi:MAG: hypothetical protein V1723_04845 [Candidatus Uhrbacteria bacterium]